MRLETRIEKDAVARQGRAALQKQRDQIVETTGMCPERRRQSSPQSPLPLIDILADIVRGPYQNHRPALRATCQLLLRAAPADVDSIHLEEAVEIKPQVGRGYASAARNRSTASRPTSASGRGAGDRDLRYGLSPRDRHRDRLPRNSRRALHQPPSRGSPAIAGTGTILPPRGSPQNLRCRPRQQPERSP
jgi:hypothetical protein